MQGGYYDTAQCLDEPEIALWACKLQNHRLYVFMAEEQSILKGK